MKKSALLSTFLSLVVATVSSQAPVNFESPQAHAIAIRADGARLYAVNTPGHTLTVWSLADPMRPVMVREIPVGIEPVSVALASRTRAWVVNHVSDSISVVDLGRGEVVDTIRVEDEPGDVVFAGTPRRAFVTSMTERKVSVFDLTTHKKVGEVSIFGDDPRSLLASRDGKTVWVAITRSGNKTTIVPHTIAPLPPKPTNKALPDAPKQGILAKADDPKWKKQLGVDLPDHDVVEIDVASLTVRRSYRGVGTALFNLAQRPQSNELWVANTEALNLVRFETALRGHFIDSRITKIATGSTPKITPVDLNPGIDYTKLPNDAARAIALSQPTDVCFSPDGKTAFVAAFGTDRIAVVDAAARVTARIEVGNASGATRAPRTKRGPRALVHHPRANTLYCLNRLSNSISVLDTVTRKIVRELPMFDPTPKEVREGRGFLYDAKLSGNGTGSCAACHVDGRTDGIAWDLGNPGGTMFNNGSSVLLHPMKGALLTQTLQGFKGERMFHWRADRPGLQTFNGTFDDLMGGTLLSGSDMTTFIEFMREIRFMPNPRLNRDDTMKTTPRNESAKDGETIFLTKPNVGKDGSSTFSCVGCHSNSSGSGSFGFDGLIDQPMKTVQLRGLYKRTGREKASNGERTSGFGFGADGSSDDIEQHISNPKRFNPLTAREKRALERFLLSFRSETAPTVGFARTLDATNIGAKPVVDDVLLLIAQAEARKCDLIGKGTLDGRRTGLVYDTTRKRFVRDRANDAPLSLAELGARIALGGRVTLMGVPPGSGIRRGIDRDGDKVFDGDEGVTQYGGASPSCAIELGLDANSEPSIGNDRFAIVTSGAPAKTGGIVLVAAKRGTLRFGDLDVLVDLGSSFALTVASDADGEILAPLPIPADNALVNRSVSMQTILAAPCGRLRLAASNGLELTISK